MRGVVSGAITSTAAIVGSASKGLAKGVGAVSCDKEFVRQREEKRRINTASSGGVLSGVKAGSESVFSGFSSGLTGLVKRPFEEGRRGGALGFVKGIGLGMAGVVTKPILGVSDGIASLVHGISNQVSDSIIIKTARPPRAFDRSATDVADRVLVPLDLAAAHAQDYVLKQARVGGYSDSFISHICIDGSRYGCFSSDLSFQASPSQSDRKNLSKSGPNNSNNQNDSKPRRVSEGSKVITDCSSVVVSELFVYVLRRDGSCEGRYAFGEVSHCAFRSDSVTSCIELVLYQASSCSNSGGNYSNNHSHSQSANIPFSLSLSPQLLLFGDIVNNNQSSSNDNRNRITNTNTNSNSSDLTIRKRPQQEKRSSNPVNTGSLPEEKTVVMLQCKSRIAAVKLYEALAVCAAQMGNPSSVLPADVATATATATAATTELTASSSSSSFIPALSPSRATVSPSSSSARNLSQSKSETGTGIQSYRFGKANITKHTFVQCSDKDLMQRSARRLAEPLPALPPSSGTDDIEMRRLTETALFAKFLDERVWHCVSEWRDNHQQLQSSRCLAVLIINQSTNPVQILRHEMQEGKNTVIFGVSAMNTPRDSGMENQRGYDEESRTLKGGGGAAVIFAFGFLPTPIDIAHVKVNIATSAFNATVSTRPNRTLCVAVGGHTAGYLEKSLSDYWAKYTIVVN